MSVYNAEQYLAEAIDSVLIQTFKDFEFIIINDASTDKSLDIINTYKDSRIKLINKEKNKGFIGFVENLNIGLDIARGEYIARMDADDICDSKRFKTQIDYLDNNQNTFMVGSSINLINEEGLFIRKKNATQGFLKIVDKFNYTNPMYHPTLMFRRSSIRYRYVFLGCEDFDFHLQHLLRGYKLENLDESLLSYRLLNDSISRSTDKLKVIISMEEARKVFNKREYKLSDTTNKILDNYLNNKLTISDKKYILNLAIKYDLESYPELLNKFKLNSIYYNIFLIRTVRKVYSKLIFKFFPIIKI